jgi:hypothetical protein
MRGLSRIDFKDKPSVMTICLKITRNQCIENNMNMTRHINVSFWKSSRHFFCLVFMGLFFIFSSQAMASSSQKEIRLSEPVLKSLQYLLGLLNTDTAEKITTAQIAPIIDFVSSQDKTWPALYYSEDNFKAESAYHEFEIHQGLEEILTYAYSGTIPSQAFIPSSVRLSYWKNFNGPHRDKSWSWKYPAPEGHFQIVRGIQHEATTPDVSSWTYYSYDLDRLLMLSRYKDHNVFFSISNQKGKAPGKKAFALGGDKDWNYLYTQETGVNKAGLGWVTPYMYESFSITVFVELPDKSSVKCAMFKWLNAGAANINMVKKHHIQEGIKRFETGFKMVLENPNLPKPLELAAAFSQIDDLPIEDMRNEISRYFHKVTERYHQDDVFKDKKLTEFFKSSEYLNQLTREEMKSILNLEYMKTILKKNPVIPVNRLFSQL